MNILESIGVIAIAFLIVYIAVKIDYYRFNKKTGSEVSEKIYLAAKAFSKGESAEQIRNILINCIDFDEEDIEEVLTLSTPRRSDSGGGYQAFLEAVNKVLGEILFL